MRTKPSVSPIQAMVRGESGFEVGSIGEPGASPTGALIENTQRRIVQQAVAGEDVGAFDVELAVPGGDLAAGFLEDRHQSAQVPGMNAVLDHQLAGALGDENEAVEIAEAALTLGL